MNLPLVFKYKLRKEFKSNQQEILENMVFVKFYKEGRNQNWSHILFFLKIFLWYLLKISKFIAPMLQNISIGYFQTSWTSCFIHFSCNLRWILDKRCNIYKKNVFSYWFRGFTPPPILIVVWPLQNTFFYVYSTQTSLSHWEMELDWDENKKGGLEVKRKDA